MPADRPLKRLTSILVKPTGADCNIDCAYCFYLDRAGVLRPGFQHDGRGFDRLHGRRVSGEVQEEMVKQVMRDGTRQVSFGWQGGEPTMMGLAFFERTVDLQRRYGSSGQVVGNGLQTNGLLIDEKWCVLFRETNWLVGLSIDGPAHVHDRYRLTRHGKPTYERVREKAQLMREERVEFNALSVVNDYSARFPREIYEHHKDLGIFHMQFIPCVERDPEDPTRAASFSVSAEDYGHFLCEIFDCWKADFKDGRPTVSVRYFDSVFYTYVNLAPPECTLLKECGNYVVVEHNGDVYSCDFYVEDSWLLGNVMEGRLVDMLNSERQKEFGLVKRNMPPECKECRWLTHCRGGCPKDRQRDPADRGSNHFCKSFMKFFDRANDDLEALAQDWIEEQSLAQERERKTRQRATSRQVAPPGKVPRNAPCPCGSGKKYKKCCGIK